MSVNVINSNAFCVEDIINIENYEKAVKDETQTYACHHRLETHTSDGERNHFYGKHHSEETKQKIAEAKKGENNPLYGKHWKLVDGKRVYY